MTKLKSELEVLCPCCGATLVIDTNLGRVIEHREPEREDKPDLDAAQKILADEQARREAIFQQSVEAEKTRGDALSRRFEEALKQARQEPITKPKRDFDLDCTGYRSQVTGYRSTGYRGGACPGGSRLPA